MDEGYAGYTIAEYELAMVTQGFTCVTRLDVAKSAFQSKSLHRFIFSTIICNRHTHAVCY